MKRHSILMAVFCLCMAFVLVGGYVPMALAIPAPVTIDFEDQTTGTFTQIDTEGFRLAFIGWGDLQTITDVSGNNVLKDSDITNASGAEIKITSLDGSNFYFNSLDYNNFTTDPSWAIRVTAYPASSSSVWQELNPTSAEYATLTGSNLGVNSVPLSELRVNIVSMGGDFSVDNINLTHAAINNNNFADRITISGQSGSTTGDNYSANTESGEFYAYGGATVWYEWTAPATGTAEFDTFGSNYDTYLCSFYGGIDEAHNLTYNDDWSGLQSYTAFSAIEGRTYYISVGGFAGSQGSFTLSWSMSDIAPVQTIDIRPLGEPNNVNLKARGVLPVAIFGAEEFDVTTIDTASILLGTTNLAHKGKGTNNFYAYEDVNGDQITDIICHFSIPELVANGDVDSDTTELTLTASLSGGGTFSDSDSIRIVPEK